ncbi:MAG: hypothetical protein LH473_06450, partial [Chitinophagales bacterium]|nr:hypothetical protein [Chitinophagales bacterium]
MIHKATLTSADSIFIAEWKGKSIHFYSTNQDSFASIQLQIAAKYKQADQLSAWLNCYDTVIRAYRISDQFDKAINTYSDLYKNIWRKPDDSVSLVTLAESNRQIARIYSRELSVYAKALSFFDEGIKLMTQAHKWNPEAARIFYKAAGNCASRMDDYEKSVNYQLKNIQVCRDFKDTIKLWMALNDLSYPYMQAGQFQKAEQALRECYALNINSDSAEQKVDVCDSYTDLFIITNQLDSALKYNQLCFIYLKQWSEPEEDSEADLFRKQAKIYSLKKNYTAAEKSYAKAVSLMMLSDENKRRECGKVLGEFGSMYVDAGKENLALEKFHESLQCLIPDFKSSDVNALPDTSMLYDENGIFITCEWRGDAYMKLFYSGSNKKHL